MYIDYDHSIVSLSNSILKHFGFTPYHKTNEVVDEILEKGNYDNVMVILFDGMGVYNIKNTLSPDSFIRKNLKHQMTSTFPPTTAASTTSLKTGLYPSEHLYLAWDVYFSEEDDCIDIFINRSKKGRTYDYHVIDKYTKPTTIMETIRTNPNLISKEISKFGDINFNSLEELDQILKEEASKPGKKFFYVYDPEPDHTMHLEGVHTIPVKEKIEKINKFLENLKLENTLVIVTADHGHITANHLKLDDYPKLKEILRTPTCIEDRSVGFNIKEGTDDILLEHYNKYFKDDFILYTKDEVIKNKLFGLTNSKNFTDFLPDYLMCSISNKALVDDPDKLNYLKGMHAGLTDEEGYIPLIFIPFN